MSNFSICPRCRQLVAIPSHAEARSRVRCPLCNAEYELQDALGTVPELIVLSTPADTLTDFSPAVAATVHEDPAPSIPELTTAASKSSEAQGAPADGPQPTITSAEIAAPYFLSGPASMTSFGNADGIRSTAAPGKRKRSNPVIELVKIVLGGAAGIVIAYAILLWIFKVDPFQMGDKLPRFMVPEALRPAAAASDE